MNEIQMTTEEQIETFVACVFEPDDLVEVRRLPSAQSTWCKASELTQHTGSLTAENEAGQNVYCGANPRSRPGGSKAADVSLARCLFADFDGVSPDDASAAISAGGLPTPTLLLNSGHGAHAYWRLAEPLTDLGAWTAAQKQLIAALKSDPSIHDSPRIMRLPGFLNRKSGKPDAACRIIDADPQRRQPINSILNIVPATESPLPIREALIAGASVDSSTLDRAWAYIDAIEGTAEGGRNNAAFRVAAVLQNDFNLPPAAAEPLLRQWNQRNTPPLDDGELTKVMHHAAKYGTASPGNKLVQPASVLGEISAPAVILPSREIHYQRFTAAELDSQGFIIEYLINGLLAAKQPLILAGPKKALKTSLLLDASVSLATASPFLGSFSVCRQARTAVMSGESGLATIQETLRRICKARSRELKQVQGLIVSPDLPRFGDSRHQVALEKFISNDEVEVIALDPAYLCMPGADAGNLFAQGELLRSVSEVCERKGVTLMLCHHTKKGVANPFAPPELEDISWAGFQEFARQWWLLGRRERYQPGTGNHTLWLSVGGSAGHSGLWRLDIREGAYSPGTSRLWDVTASSVEDGGIGVGKRQTRAAFQATQLQDKAAAIRSKIAEALQAAPDHADTKTGIRSRIGAKGKNFDTAFESMVTEGQLKPTKIKRDNNHTYDGYELALVQAA